MFETIIATTSRQKEEAYRLRYQVYCTEHGYEDPSELPDGIEKDEFDAHSMHALLVHSGTNICVGTARLVMPNPRFLDRSFPVQRVCEYSPVLDPNRSPIESMAEVSRFCISKHFRREVERSDAPPNRAETMRLCREMTVQIIKGLVRMSVMRNITHWCAVMEPTLLRLLGGIGIYFKPLGPMVEFHGRRQPCYQHLPTLLQRVESERPDIWNIMTADGAHWEALREQERAREQETPGIRRAEIA